MAKLPDFITAENELDGQEHVYIAQGGKTRKTLLQKIKEFVIGTTTMGTTATDITGAIAEHTSQLNDMTKNKQDKIEDTGWINLALNDGIIARSGATPQIRKIGKEVFLRGAILAKCLSSTSNVALFSIPSGFISSKLIEFTSISAISYFIDCYIPTNGTVYARINAQTTNDAHYFFLEDCSGWLID